MDIKCHTESKFHNQDVDFQHHIKQNIRKESAFIMERVISLTIYEKTFFWKFDEIERFYEFHPSVKMAARSKIAENFLIRKRLMLSIELT